MLPLSHSDNSGIYPGKDFDAVSCVGCDRCPDEKRMIALIYALYLDISLEGLFLAPEGVPEDRHIHEPESLYTGIINRCGQQHHPGAGGKDTPLKIDEWFVQPVLLDQS